MSNHTLYAVLGDGGDVVTFFTSDCAVSFPDDVPASVDRHLSPNTDYVVCQVGMLTPVVAFASPADPPETNHENDDSAPPTPTASKSTKSKA